MLSFYIIVALICFNGAEASIVKHVHFEQTHLISVSESTYGIVLQDNDYVWKVVTVNGDEVTVVNGLCEVERNLAKDLPTYANIYENLSSLNEGKLPEGSALLLESIDESGTITPPVSVNTYLMGKTDVLVFKLPFSQAEQTTRFLVNKQFLAIIDGDNQLKMRALNCLDDMMRNQLVKLIEDKNRAEFEFNPERSPSLAIRSQSIGEFGRVDSSGSNFEEDTRSDPLFASIFGVLPDDQRSQPARITFNQLDSLSRSIDSGSVRGLPQGQLTLIDALLDAGRIDSSKCNPDSLRLWANWHSQPELMNPQTNIRRYIMEFSEEQLQLCVESLQGTITLHGRQIAVEVREFLMNFMTQVNDQINADAGNATDHDISIHDPIPARSLYAALVSFIRCRDVDLAKATKAAPKENVKFVLADSVERHLGKFCHKVETVLAEDIKQLEMLSANQYGEPDPIQVRTEVSDLLNVARACRLISDERLDKDRLAAAFNLVSGKKLLSCFHPQ